VVAINQGDGQIVSVHVRFSLAGVDIRRLRKRRVWHIPLKDAVGILARAAQRREAELLMGRKRG
jgi:hypothetical protein